MFYVITVGTPDDGEEVPGFCMEKNNGMWELKMTPAYYNSITDGSMQSQIW